ncbi:MAG: family 16 glycosylhydrolase, partial [Chitinophagales bacterium]
FLTATTLFFAACSDKSGDDTPTPELPKISIGSATLFEGNDNQTFRFQVSVSAASEEVIQVNYATEEITATEGTDFVRTVGVLSIEAGEKTAFIDVEILTDELKEPDEEFRVMLSNAVNAKILQAEGLGTIRNDDTFVFVPEDGYITPESYTGYNSVWSDEFEGTALNTSDWTHEIGGHGWGNEELQYYTDRTENAYLTDGNLVIEAKKESHNGSAYTSARLITQNKKSFALGRIDIRAILPEGQGIWPALWMLGQNFGDIGWPACGEIDIMELVGHEPSTTHGTAHWGSQGQGYSNYKGGHYAIGGEKFSEKYHVFSLVWEANSIKWYVDDNEFYSLTNSDVNGNYPFNSDFFFIFNIAVGGKWPGSPDATTQFPQRMYVDYVRVFQK